MEIGRSQDRAPRHTPPVLFLSHPWRGLFVLDWTKIGRFGTKIILFIYKNSETVSITFFLFLILLCSLFFFIFQG